MKPIPATQVKTIKRMRKEGHTINHIVQATGLSVPTVRKYIKKKDVKP